jgi:pyruvate/2-oxoglutarate dehydrogenase complex dihydrolipoamide dehydrogenase (E3) component
MPLADVTDFDTLILGSGEAGKYIAWAVASAGRSAAVVERRYVGGSCPNVACLPSKNVVYSAKVAHLLKRHDQFGLRITGDASVDMAGVRDRKRRMVEGLGRMHLEKFRHSGAELIMGSGRAVGDRTVEVTLADGGTRTLRGKHLILSTGTRAAIDATPGLAEAKPMTHVELLEIDVLPDHLIVLGGGYVGLEFAQAMRRLGSRVTVVDRNGRLVHREDADVSAAIAAAFAADGVEVLTDAHVERVTGVSGQQVALHGTRNGTPFTLDGSHLLAATGRTPNTAGIGLESAGVALTDRGYIRVDDHLRTTAPGVWAVGDCAGSPHFTHVAYDDFRVVREQLLGDGRRSTAGRQVPSCTFVDPEFARVGLSETDARRAGVAYRLAKVPMAAVLRSRTMDETDGFLKALVSTTDDTILGFAGVGVGAGEILATVQLAMSAGLPYTVLRDMIVTHPTLAEGVVALFSAVPGKS